MLKKMFAATTALIMIFSSFAVSYAEEAAEKQYIVRLKTSDVQLMMAAGISLTSQMRVRLMNCSVRTSLNGTKRITV